MALSALALILVAAFLHAGWNLLAKRAGGGVVFVWLFATLAALIYAPLAMAWIIYNPPAMSAPVWLCIIATSVLHLGYFLSLQRGYQVGDLSLVYPLARGTGPMLATLAAIVFFGERPTVLALGGTVAIVGGVFVLSGGLRRVGQPRPPGAAVGYGVLTGVLIAAYTLLDKYAVSGLLISPLIYDWCGNLGRALLITPYVLRRRDEVAREWRSNRWLIVGVAIMSPLAYILVLTAMTFTPVSYVAPAREVSILVGVILGARFLSEGQLGLRLAAAAGIVCGICALVLG